MVKPGKCPRAPAWRGGSCRFLFVLLVFLCGLGLTGRAAIQFDVFPGYEGVVSEATWVPMVCELRNDGPSFTGVIEVQSEQFSEGQVRRMVVELPTGTLKRVDIPVFSSARFQTQSRWDFRLLDEGGRVRAEQIGVQPTKLLASHTIIMGALPRTSTGMPVIRQVLSREKEAWPSAARIQTALLPDNPLVLEGMDCVYLNSEKALELRAEQVEALLAWLNDGGHLIVAVEQVSDVNGTPWLRSLVPCNLTDQQTVNSHAELQQWLRKGDKKGNAFGDLSEDTVFEAAPLQVAVATPKEGGQVVAAAGNVPLLVRSNVGRGRVTALLFSPEREPVRSWKNLPSFWARLAEVPQELYLTENNNNFRPGMSIDGVFGAMIDSKQVRKLPVEWLLLLLVVYLVVIGPFDQYWLKRIKRPMLTWVTFPCYVVLFSLLIYFIGYKLRAGESEWNELHLVDVFAKKEGVGLRGRTYASIYSPVNSKYRVEGQQDCSTFRGEFQSFYGGQDSERADVLQNGDNFKADIFVPVWTSKLYVSDWWQSQPLLPFEASISSEGANWVVKVNNHLDRPLMHAQVVVGGRVLELGELPAGQAKTFRLGQNQGVSLRDFVSTHAFNFQNAAQSRQHAFGNSISAQLSDLPNASMAASFVSELNEQQGSRFVAPPGLDLTDVVERGNAVVLAWSDNYSPIKPMNQFTPRRSHKDTLWRMTVPVNGSASL